MDMETIEIFIDDVKNFIIGGIICLGVYLALNYILYAIEKYVN